jgi:aminoglycoside phosphotransferase
MSRALQLLDHNGARVVGSMLQGAGMMDVTTTLTAALADYAFEPISLGESGASVWRCTTDGAPTFYLKTAALAADLRLDEEAMRLRWMKEHDLPVPTVRAYGHTDNAEYLLLDEVPGVAASDPAWRRFLPEVVAALGEGLARLHRTPIADCPFDHRLARQVNAACRRVAAGRVREEDFDEERAGRDATDLLTELLTTTPEGEDLVFSHGDFCLPNVVLDRATDGALHIAGLVDCGRAGVADRHQDLALAVRSITHNLGRGWVRPFLRAYGLPRPHEDRLRFYTLLDEFF